MKLNILKMAFFAGALSVGALACGKTDKAESTTSAKAKEIKVDGNWELVANHLNFPEGVVDLTENEIWWSNCDGQWISRFRKDTGVVDTLVLKPAHSEAFQSNGMFALDAENVLVTEYGTGQILRVHPDGTWEVEIDGYNGKHFNRPNDIRRISEDWIAISDPHTFDKEAKDGRLYFYNLKTKELRDSGLHFAFPNGMAYDAENETLFLSESAFEHVLALHVTQEAVIDTTSKRVFVDVAGGEPDGLEFTEDGILWIAHFGGQDILRVNRDGEIVERVVVPGKNPTNMEFVGDELFITVADTHAVFRASLVK